MKKMFKSVLGLLALCFATTASAQAPLFSMFDYSAKVGVSIANMSESNSRMSFYMGGAAEYYIDEYLSLQPELIISGQGAREKFELNDSKNVSTTRLTYLDIPVMVKVAPFPGSGISIEAGPMMGLCMGAKMKNKTTTSSATTVGKESVYNIINKVQFGLCLGASYVIDNNIGAQIRYNHGLTNVVKTSDVKTTNSSFEIGAFYLF